MDTQEFKMKGAERSDRSQRSVRFSLSHQLAGDLERTQSPKHKLGSSPRAGINRGALKRLQDDLLPALDVSDRLWNAYIASSRPKHRFLRALARKGPPQVSRTELARRIVEMISLASNHAKYADVDMVGIAENNRLLPFAERVLSRSIESRALNNERFRIALIEELMPSTGSPMARLVKDRIRNTWGDRIEALRR